MVYPKEVLQKMNQVVHNTPDTQAMWNQVCVSRALHLLVGFHNHELRSSYEQGHFPCSVSKPGFLLFSVQCTRVGFDTSAPLPLLQERIATSSSSGFRRDGLESLHVRPRERYLSVLSAHPALLLQESQVPVQESQVVRGPLQSESLPRTLPQSESLPRTLPQS